MKRLLLLFISLVLCMVLAACGCKHEVSIDPAVPATCTESGMTEGSHCTLCDKVLKKQEVIPAKGHTEVVLEKVDATCTESGLTEGKGCSECGEVFQAQKTIEPLGHKGTSKCITCGENVGDWEIRYYVDNFNQPTTDAYIINADYFVGVFSNSATTNSLLYAEILVDKDNVCIFLYEYGNRQVKTYSSTDYNIAIKTDDGKNYTLEGTMYSDRIYIGDILSTYSSDRNKVIQALQTSQTTYFYIEDARYGDSYLFAVNSSNFTALYNQMNYNQWG